ncbi:MAG: hypothetical protein HC914_03295 [Chloroflexaceae bacterium]|nr:hypothetical protein [Chloroflexaceae bacterium]
MSIQSNIQRSFLTGWTVATMIGLVLGWVAATMLLIGWANGGITESLSAAIGRYAAAMASYALSGALLGVLVGVGQWFMLRRRLHEAGWWSVASTFGGAVGGAATIAVNLQLPPLQQTLEQMFVPALLTALIGGVAGGLAQWVVLRRQVDGAAAWVGINTAAWVLSVALFLGSLLLFNLVLGSTSLPVVGVVVPLLFGVLFFLLLPAAITGYGLLWLTRPRTD